MNGKWICPFFRRASLPIEHFDGEIQPRKLRIASLQHVKDAQRLGVVREATVFAEALVEHRFAGVAERRVANVMGQREAFDQILIQA